MSLKVAVLGGGYFARFQHEAWARLPGVDLVGIADLDPARAEAACAAHGGRAFGDPARMLHETSPDILDIAIPPEGHADAIRMGLAAGAWLIVCQKPFASDLATAEALTAEAEAAGIPLVIHENFRWQPWFRVMRQAIVEGRVGAVQNITFRLRTGDGQGRDAYLDRQPYFQTMPRLLIHETGVHYFDTFRFLMGQDPTHIYADLRRMNPAIAGEDAGHVLFDYPGHARALLDGNRLLDHASDNTRRTFGEALIEGNDGSLSLDGSGRVILRAFGQATAETLLDARNWLGFAGDCVHALQAHLVQALEGNRDFENIARDYLGVLRMEVAAYRSAQDGCKLAL